MIKMAAVIESETVTNILRNEKYIGDALLQKTYTVDFLTKKRVKNNGLVPQYYLENSHEAIIPREIFMQVQEELIRRRIVHTSPNGKNRTFSSTHSFSNMIICGGCGEFYRRIIGTIMAKSRLFGAASAGWKTPASSAMPVRYWRAPLSRYWLQLLVRRCARRTPSFPSSRTTLKPS